MSRTVPLLTLAVLAACAPAAAPAEDGPPFVPERWFQGRTTGSGEFRRTIGGVQSRFEMVIEGGWDGRVLTMDETFVTRKGRWNRVWTITRLDGGRYEGRLTTGHGPATITVAGDTVRMHYRADAPLLERPFTARFEQTLRLRPDGTVLNVADVYKWGIKVGRSTVVFRKGGLDAQPHPSSSGLSRGPSPRALDASPFATPTQATVGCTPAGSSGQARG